MLLTYGNDTNFTKQINNMGKEIIVCKEAREYIENVKQCIEGEYYSIHTGEFTQDYHLSTDEVLEVLKIQSKHDRINHLREQKQVIEKISAQHSNELYKLGRKYIENMENKELKPCPFCGSETIVVENYDESCNSDYPSIYWHSVCVDCGCNIPMCDTEEEAIEAWNKRDYTQFIEFLELVRKAIYPVNISEQDIANKELLEKKYLELQEQLLK